MYAALRKYRDDQPRDERGRWTADTLGGAVLVSPNEEANPGMRRASEKLRSYEQHRLHAVSERIDRFLGSSARVHDAYGAWVDDQGVGGAENSAIVSYPKGASFNDMRFAAAMKGYLFNQKSVGLFKPGAGDDFLTVFTADATPEHLNRQLTEAGLIYHTLVPTSEGTKVVIMHMAAYDPQASIAKVRDMAKEYGAQATIHKGRGEFIGDTDGNRDKARDEYQRIIAEEIAARGETAGRFWDDLRHFAETRREALVGSGPIGWRRAA